MRPLRVFHGKVARGLSIETSVKNGHVTLFSVVESGNGNLTLSMAEGESVFAPILEIGNTNCRDRFSIGARRFIEAWDAQGPAHHCAIASGISPLISKRFAALLKMEAVRVC